MPAGRPGKANSPLAFVSWTLGGTCSEMLTTTAPPGRALPAESMTRPSQPGGAGPQRAPPVTERGRRSRRKPEGGPRAPLGGGVVEPGDPRDDPRPAGAERHREAGAGAAPATAAPRSAAAAAGRRHADDQQ